MVGPDSCIISLNLFRQAIRISPQFNHSQFNSLCSGSSFSYHTAALAELEVERERELNRKQMNFAAAFLDNINHVCLSVRKCKRAPKGVLLLSFSY